MSCVWGALANNMMLVGVDFVLGAADCSEATLPSRTAWCYHYMLALFWSADCKNRCIVLRGSELDKWVFVVIVYLQIRRINSTPVIGLLIKWKDNLPAS